MLFSCLKPGTHLRPHCGSTNTRLTAHLGVVIPPGCSIRAADETREWTEGECIVFDDSFEHEVHHRGDSDREHYSRGHIPDFGEQMGEWSVAPLALLCPEGIHTALA